MKRDRAHILRDLSWAMELLQKSYGGSQPERLPIRCAIVHELLHALEQLDQPEGGGEDDIDLVAECKRIEEKFEVWREEFSCRDALQRTGLKVCEEQLAALTERVGSSTEGMLARFDLNRHGFDKQTIKINAVDARVAELAGRVEEVGSEHCNMQSEARSTVSRFESWIGALNGTLAAHSSRLNRHDKQIETLGNTMIGDCFAQDEPPPPAPACEHPPEQRVRCYDCDDKLTFTLCLDCGARRYCAETGWLLPALLRSEFTPKPACEHGETCTVQICGLPGTSVPATRCKSCGSVQLSGTWFVPEPPSPSEATDGDEERS